MVQLRYDNLMGRVEAGGFRNITNHGSGHADPTRHARFFYLIGCNRKMGTPFEVTQACSTTEVLRPPTEIGMYDFSDSPNRPTYIYTMYRLTTDTNVLLRLVPVSRNTYEELCYDCHTVLIPNSTRYIKISTRVDEGGKY